MRRLVPAVLVIVSLTAAACSSSPATHRAAPPASSGIPFRAGTSASSSLAGSSSAITRRSAAVRPSTSAARTSSPAPAPTHSASQPVPRPSTSHSSVRPTPAHSSATASAPRKATITIDMHMFMGTMRVAPGAKITVRNVDTDPHTLTAVDGKFDTGNIPAMTGVGAFTAPTTPGSYSIYCQYHSDMHGTLVVV